MEEYEVNLVLAVDPESNFFESDREENVQIILELIKNALYDIDDVKINYIDVERH